jgi:hypothetical protein
VGPAFSRVKLSSCEDLDKASRTKVSYHCRLLRIFLNQDEENPLPLILGGGLRPEFLKLLKDLALDFFGGYLKKPVGHLQFTWSRVVATFNSKQKLLKGKRVFE